MPELKNSTRPEAVVIIRNIKGLHARASAKFVKCAESYNADVTVTREGQAVGGTSIMGGRGGYSGTIVGALILTVVTTLLTVLEMPEAVRQVLFGVIIVAVAAAYTRVSGDA